MIVSPAQAGLVDANDAHLLHLLLPARLGDAAFDPSPQLLVAHAQPAGCLAHRQVLAHRQRFKQQREVAALTLCT